jgi:periplasmic protein TonB
MALKREFNESRERMGPQNPGKPANRRAENVDNLVSSFLDELSNLSSEVNGPADQVALTETPAETNDSKMPPHFKLQDDSRSRAVLDLERIDADIEEALAELEQLKSAKAGANRKPIPEAQPELMPPVSVPKVEETPKTSPVSPPPLELGADLQAPLVSRDSDDEAWKRPDLFRNAISMPAQTERRPVLAWVLAGLILIAILAIAAIFLSKSDNPQPGAKEKTGMLEEYKSDAATRSADDRNEKQELLPAAADLKKSLPASEPVIQPERHKESRLSSGPEVGSRSSMGGAKTGSSSGILGSGRPVEDRQNGPPPKIRTAREPSQQAAPQNAPVSAAPDTPSPIATSSESAVQAKQEPAPPAVQPNARSVPEPEVHAGAPARETPIEIPKPATPVEPDQTTDVSASPGMVQAAEIIKRVQPEYPVLARRQEISGTVEVEVDVNEKGEVVLARAVSGPSLLRPAAEAAIMNWRFKPASVGGESVPSKAKVSVSFSLQ